MSAAGEAEGLRHCYVCKQDYSGVHHFYDQLCLKCGELNYAKRTELADLSGRLALVTGGRVKIGYQRPQGVALRRPPDRQYALSARFRDPLLQRARLRGVVRPARDLRSGSAPHAERRGFCRELLAREDRLDYIVNNACQTVRRPPAFYEHMMAGETAALETMPAATRKLVGSYEDLRDARPLLGEAEAALSGDVVQTAAGLVAAAHLTQVPLLPGEQDIPAALFPSGALDQDQQQVDRRATNSWRMLMADVPTVELLEVHLVNAVAPFVLNARLKPLMLRTGRARQAHRQRLGHGGTVLPHLRRPTSDIRTRTWPKPVSEHAHPHLGRRTIIDDGIHMNSVDTGWVTDEDAEAIAARKTAVHRFHPPLDIVDGAARIVDPIITGANTGDHVWGQFLKDYRPADW